MKIEWREKSREDTILDVVASMILFCPVYEENSILSYMERSGNQDRVDVKEIENIVYFND